jgi:hypothetical protein
MTDQPEKLDWLVWSIKWKRWYRPDAMGYTSSLAKAGLWTEAGARHHAMRGITRAVKLSAARKQVAEEIAMHEAEIARLRGLLPSERKAA